MIATASNWRSADHLARGAGALVAALVLAVALVGLVEQMRGVDTGPDPAAIVAYEEALSGPARDGGVVIQEGLKRGLAQLGNDTPAPVAFQAVSWVATLEDVRKRFAEAGDGLQDPDLITAAKLFDDALVQYKHVATTIGAASIANGEPRARLLDEAAASGRAADATYDAASTKLQAARQKAGLPPTARFPNPKEER